MSDKIFNIEEELKKLPASPGVYLMHNQLDEIIYVGKAVVLKNRVRQYFQSERGKTTKIRRMIKNIASFEYIVTDSEEEAFLLECNLIKKYRPRYNTLMTDDKGYQLIAVTVSENFPRVLSCFREGNKNDKYFGPFVSGTAVKNTVEFLHRIYRLRTCRKKLPDKKTLRPCLNYDLGKCSAPCVGKISAEEYRKNIDEVLRFLNGDSIGIRRDIRTKMNEAAEMTDYETAITYRELLNSLSAITEKQKMTVANSADRHDVIGYAIHDNEGIVSVFTVKDGKLSGREHYHMKNVDPEEPLAMLSEFLHQYYVGSADIPSEIHLSEEPEGTEMLLSVLSREAGRKIRIVTPKKGEKSRMLSLAAENARMKLESDRERILREEEREKSAVNELAGILGMEKLSRMEAFDISNISGYESVGSMVVYVDGRAKKNDYRKFRIKSVVGPDDYKSMQEVLTRRFTHEKKDNDESFSSLPDLILMDGGKGQVHVAEKVLSELRLSIPVCGMVKDDRHRTRGLYYHDRELSINTRGEAFHLLTRIQDEAHRFAITYHRGLHTKGQIQSVLREIPSVGPKRENVLMRNFENIEALKNATAEELAKLEGFNEKAALHVYRYFHPDTP